MRNLIDKALTAFILTATLCLFAWIYVLHNSTGETVGVINRVFVEKGVTKLEFTSDSGQKEIYEYSGVGDAKQGRIKLKFLKIPIFFTPKATALEELSERDK